MTQTPDPIEKEEREEMVFGSEERREQMEKQRRKREKRTEVGERNFGSGIKYIYFFRILIQYNSKFRIVL